MILYSAYWSYRQVGITDSLIDQFYRYFESAKVLKCTTYIIFSLCFKIISPSRSLLAVLIRFGKAMIEDSFVMEITLRWNNR